SHTSPTMFQAAFSAIGKTADIWDWDDMGMPTTAILHSYDAVLVDESGYFDTTQKDTLGAFLSASDGSPQRIFIMGRDLSYGSSARPWMEQYTGTAYVKDDPGFRFLRGMSGDPIGYGQKLTISGSYPDELKLSTTYPGAQIVFKYYLLSAPYELFDNEQDYKEFYEKEGKEWDPKILPMAPSGPDSIAAARYVGPHHAAVYFAFQFSYMQNETQRAVILDRVLNWLSTAASMGADLAIEEPAPEAPDKLTLWQNYPNPFNPVTTIKVAIPAGHQGAVSLKVYNVTGRLVKTIYAGTKPAGIYTFEWDGTNNTGQIVSSGIYFSRFTAGDVNLTKKMILLK
ncbi:MAG: FlgD immunoglobulin-like domain containing protein, partial [Candidatus Latescibacterota bacterium]